MTAATIATDPRNTLAPCANPYCADRACSHRAAQHAVTGRWFITMGHAGFNLPVNNGRGYATEARAIEASKACMR